MSILDTIMLAVSAAGSLASVILHALAQSGNKTAGDIANDVDAVEKEIPAVSAAVKAGEGK